MWFPYTMWKFSQRLTQKILYIHKQVHMLQKLPKIFMQLVYTPFITYLKYTNFKCTTHVLQASDKMLIVHMWKMNF